jgi:hypothetical protein
MRPPRANTADLELEDDAATTVLPLRWPEPPKDLAERLRNVPTDGVGLSRSVPASTRPRRAWLWRALALAFIVGVGLRMVPPRTFRHAATAPVPRLQPVTPTASPAPPPPAAPLETILPIARPATTKPPIDVSSLPKAAPTTAPPPRPAPRRVIKPAPRPPPPPPQPADPPAPTSHIDENAYDDAPTAKRSRLDNPY